MAMVWSEGFEEVPAGKAKEFWDAHSKAELVPKGCVLREHGDFETEVLGFYPECYAVVEKGKYRLVMLGARFWGLRRKASYGEQKRVEGQREEGS